MSNEKDSSSSLAPAPEVSKVVLSCLVAGLFIAVIAGVVYFGNDDSQVSTAAKPTTTAASQTNVLGSVTEAESTTARSIQSVSTTVATTVKKQTTMTEAPTTSAKATTTVASSTTVLPTTTVAAPASTVSLKPATDTEPSADDWSKLRDCEASGNYQISSRNGLYHGAYQFDQSTWDGTAKKAGRTDLVGILPAKADPADQDAMALELYRSRGAQPWPTCGRYLK